MQMFVDADEAYLAWTRWHPEGYVLHVGRTPSPSTPIVLHLAVCELISSPGMAYTTGDYIKICSLERQSLIEWSEREDAEGELSTDHHCLHP